MPHLKVVEWDIRDQMQRVDLGGGGQAYYVYDGTGKRVRKLVERPGSVTEERVYLGGFEVFRRAQRDRMQTEHETLHVMDGEGIAFLETTDPRRAVIRSLPQSPRQRYQLANHLIPEPDLDENGRWFPTRSISVRHHATGPPERGGRPASQALPLHRQGA